MTPMKWKLRSRPLDVCTNWHNLSKFELTCKAYVQLDAPLWKTMTELIESVRDSV